MKDRDYRSNTLTTKDARDQLRAYGLAVVPIKPSPEMLIAAIKIGGVSTEAAWNIYNAMVDAYRSRADYAAMIERHLQRDVDDRPMRMAAGARNRTT